MSNFQEPVRVYNFGDARLLVLALEKIAFARRDETELETVGIDAAFVDDLETKAIAFGEAPSDDVERSEQAEATEEKNEDADALRDKLKELRSAAKRAFGEKSTKFNSFQLDDLDDANDDNLLRKGMVAKGVATTYATELEAKGYDAADNTELATLCNNYVGGLQNQSIEVGSRDTAQENRVVQGNELYHLLENELCEAAKSYWRTRSAAKYNDYIIYNNEHGLLIPDDVITIPLTANQIATLSSDTDPEDDSLAYGKNNGPEGCEIAIYFANINTDAYSGTGIVLTSGQARNFRASDIGPVQSFLMTQNISDVDGSLDFGVVE